MLHTYEATISPSLLVPRRPSPEYMQEPVKFLEKRQPLSVKLPARAVRQ